LKRNPTDSSFQVDSAKLWDLPDKRVPMGIAASGKQSCELFAPLAQVMVGIDPEPKQTDWWDEARSAAAPAAGVSRKVAQLPISWDSDKTAAVDRAHRLFRWSLGGWKVNAELPSTAGFDSAVRPEGLRRTDSLWR
jgi:hypothetical protein